MKISCLYTLYCPVEKKHQEHRDIFHECNSVITKLPGSVSRLNVVG